MARIQVRNVPEAVHSRLRSRAREDGCSVSMIVLAALVRELDFRDWKARIAKREKTDLVFKASDLLAEERQNRGPDQT